MELLINLLCEKKGRLHTIDFLVVNVSGDKPPLLSGRDAQALKYLTIYADETNAVEETTQNRVNEGLKRLCEEGVIRPVPGLLIGSPIC